MNRQTKIIIATILSLYPLIGMGIDLISPSLPAIGQNLHVSTSVVKNLISLFLVGCALGFFSIGFLTDSLGRRKLVVGGLAVFVVASLLPIYFTNITVLLIVRFIQGFTLAGFAVSARGVISDMLSAQQLIHIAPLIATMWGIGPVIGPLIGGYLQYYFGWQACFYFFALFGLVGLSCMFAILPETHFARQPLHLKQWKGNAITILTHRVFIGSAMLMGIAYSLLITFNTLGPFLIQTELGHSSVYFGHLALYMGLVFLAGTFLCRCFIKRYSPEKIFLWTIPFFLLIALVGLLFAYLDSKNIAVIIISTSLMFLACSIVYPAGMGKGLSLFKHLAGSGAAIMNLINMLIAGFTAFLMGYVNDTSAIPLLWSYFIVMICSGVIYFFLLRA